MPSPSLATDRRVERRLDVSTQRRLEQPLTVRIADLVAGRRFPVTPEEYDDLGVRRLLQVGTARAFWDGDTRWLELND